MKKVHAVDILEPMVRKWYPGKVKRHKNEIWVLHRKHLVASINSNVGGTWVHIIMSNLRETDIHRYRLSLHDPEFDFEALRERISKAIEAQRWWFLKSVTAAILVSLVLMAITYFVVTRL